MNFKSMISHGYINKTHLNGSKIGTCNGGVPPLQLIVFMVICLFSSALQCEEMSGEDISDYIANEQEYHWKNQKPVIPSEVCQIKDLSSLYCTIWINQFVGGRKVFHDTRIVKIKNKYEYRSHEKTTPCFNNKSAEKTVACLERYEGHALVDVVTYIDKDKEDISRNNSTYGAIKLTYSARFFDGQWIIDKKEMWGDGMMDEFLCPSPYFSKLPSDVLYPYEDTCLTGDDQNIYCVLYNQFVDQNYAKKLLHIIGVREAEGYPVDCFHYSDAKSVFQCIKRRSVEVELDIVVPAPVVEPHASQGEIWQIFTVVMSYTDGKWKYVSSYAWNTCT